MNIHILNIYEELKSEIKRNQESRAAVQILYNVLSVEQLEEIKSSQDVSNNAVLGEYIALAESFRAAKELNQKAKAAAPSTLSTDTAGGSQSQEAESVSSSYAAVAAHNANDSLPYNYAEYTRWGYRTK